MIQVLLALAGATGFGVIFGLPRNKLYIIAIFSGLACWIYLLLNMLFHSEGVAMFIITIIIVLVAKAIGKRIKCLAFIIATPVLIPFIPGATLYLVMNDFVGNKVTFLMNLELLCKQVGAIVAGNLVGEVLFRENSNLINITKKKRKEECDGFKRRFI